MPRRRTPPRLWVPCPPHRLRLFCNDGHTGRNLTAGVRLLGPMYLVVRAPLGNRDLRSSILMLFHTIRRIFMMSDQEVRANIREIRRATRAARAARLPQVIPTVNAIGVPVSLASVSPLQFSPIIEARGVPLPIASPSPRQLSGYITRPLISAPPPPPPPLPPPPASPIRFLILGNIMFTVENEPTSPISPVCRIPSASAYITSFRTR